MRRLPIFLLVDVSESMAGAALYKLEEGIGAIVSALRKDPYALETGFLSVIVFAGKARTIIPLTEVVQFYPPELPVGGGTALGAALHHLMNEIDRTVINTTPDRKGDWRPIVFLLTDGAPTDNVETAVQRWIKFYRLRVNLVAVSIGGQADHAILKRLTEEVVVFNDAAPDAFARFVKWVSMSIQAQSRSVSAGQDRPLSLAKKDTDLLTEVEEAGSLQAQFGGIDDRYAVFVARCAQIRLPYIIKYERHMGRIETQDPTLARLLQVKSYLLDAAVPVKASYFDLSDEAKTDDSVNTEQLIGLPACPHCNAPVGLASCGSCGGVHCVRGGGVATCPWCGTRGYYESSDGGFEVGRGRG
jgi:uncharacterized protein YegL